MCVANMQDSTNYAPMKIVRSRVTRYYPCTVDLRWQRSIHSCDSCPYAQAKASNNPVSKIAICGAVHYGVCTSVKKISSPRVSAGKGIPPFPAISISRPVPRPSAGANTTVAMGRSVPIVKVTPKFPLVTITSHGNVIRVNQRKVNLSNPLTVAKVAPRISTAPSVKVTPAVSISNMFQKIPVESYPRIVPRTQGTGGGKVHHIPIQRIPSRHGAGSPVPQTDHVARHITKPQLPIQTVRPQLPVPAPRPVTTQHLVRPQQQSQVIEKEPSKNVPVIPVSSVLPSPPKVTAPVVPATSSVIETISNIRNKAVVTAASAAVTGTTASIAAPVNATVSLPQTRNTIHVKPQSQSLLKEKEVLSKKELEIKDGDSFLALKQKEKRERDRLKERESELAKEQIRNKINTSENKSVEHLRTKKRDSFASSQSLSNRQSSVNIPQFYFPLGQPGGDSLDAVQQRIRDEFGKVDDGKMQRNQMGPVLRAMGLPVYWKCPMYRMAGGERSGYITANMLIAMWKKLTSTCHDDSSRFVKIMASAPDKNFLEYDDFVPLIQDVVDTHPGLTFLIEAKDFHYRYVQTVISRIFYCVNRSWSGRITINELRRSNFLQTLQLLEEEEDINQITDFFSYEHFYVIYCKFWELDKDHDLYISREDLARHNDHVLSSRLIDRIFSGAVTRSLVDGKMSYRDFVWFLISEEDKKHPTSIEYWFRCMDLDGDGVISMYEMEYFYEEQVQKMESIGITEVLPFEDCLCQLLDMVKPREDGKISLMDLKACKMTPAFFDTFLNLDKYLEREQKDPFADEHDELSDWERYAAEEYEILVAEEGAGDQQQEEIMYEDDFEPDDEEIPSPVDPNPVKLADPPQKKKGPKASSSEDDMYDFNTSDLGY